jgi:hypothetical protein
VRDALQAAGDAELVSDLLVQLFERGSGAQQQRAVLACSGDVRSVVKDATRQTHL